MKIKSALTLGRTGFSREEPSVATSHFTECTHCLFCGTGFSREEACVTNTHFTECTRWF